MRHWAEPTGSAADEPRARRRDRGLLGNEARALHRTGGLDELDLDLRRVDKRVGHVDAEAVACEIDLRIGILDGLEHFEEVVAQILNFVLHVRLAC